jgi:hypothetical protein
MRQGLLQVRQIGLQLLQTESLRACFFPFM